MTTFPENTSYPIQKVIQVDLNGDYAGGAAGGGTTTPGATGTLPTRTNSTAYENSRVLKASAGRLIHLRGYANMSGAQFIMLFDSATVPVTGATNFVSIFAIPGPGNFSLDIAGGEPYANGIVVANSTSDTSYAPGANNCRFTGDVL